MHDELNEVRVTLNGNKNLTIVVNEVEFNTQIGLTDKVQLFRYASFILSDVKVQEFFFNCEPELSEDDEDADLVVPTASELPASPDSSVSPTSTVNTDKICDGCGAHYTQDVSPKAYELE